MELSWHNDHRAANGIYLEREWQAKGNDRMTGSSSTHKCQPAIRAWPLSIETLPELLPQDASPAAWPMDKPSDNAHLTAALAVS
jgi:hypothetical protein